MASAAVAGAQRSYALLSERAVDSRALLRSDSCLRFDGFLSERVAGLLRAELLDGLEYERVELGGLTRQWRAVRPLGDAYFGEMARRPGWKTAPEVTDALERFESAEFTRWLSWLAGEEVVSARPVTAYPDDERGPDLPA